MARTKPTNFWKTRKVTMTLSLSELRAMRIAVEHTTTGTDADLQLIFGPHHNQVKAARRMRDIVYEATGEPEEKEEAS